jgi:hypothetical protein
MGRNLSNYRWIFCFKTFFQEMKFFQFYPNFCSRTL